MSESLEGLSSAVTRQNAGAFLNTGGAAVLPGGLNAPAATGSAEVMAAPGSLRALKSSHGPAKAYPAVKRIETRSAAESAAASGQRAWMLAERDSIFLHHCETFAILRSAGKQNMGVYTMFVASFQWRGMRCPRSQKRSATAPQDARATCDS